MENNSYIKIIPVFNPMVEPKASNCSAIWNANSRVGVRTKAKYLWPVFNKACKIGMANAPVLPDPVSAKPIISRPIRVNYWFNIFVCISKTKFHFICNQIQLKCTLM